MKYFLKKLFIYFLLKCINIDQGQYETRLDKLEHINSFVQAWAHRGRTCLFHRPNFSRALQTLRPDVEVTCVFARLFFSLVNKPLAGLYNTFLSQTLQHLYGYYSYSSYFSNFLNQNVKCCCWLFVTLSNCKQRQSRNEKRQKLFPLSLIASLSKPRFVQELDQDLWLVFQLNVILMKNAALKQCQFQT